MNLEIQYLNIMFQSAHLYSLAGNDFMRSEYLNHGLQAMEYVSPFVPVQSTWYDAPQAN